MHHFATRVVCLLLVVATMPALAVSATRYVATTGSDAANDCTVQNSPCATIQYAVDQADALDTVSVAAGIFHESVRIRKSLTLTGAGSSGTSKTTIDGDAQAGASIHIDGIGQQAIINVVVENIDVSGNQDDDGIYVNGDAVAAITDSVVSQNDHDGVYLDDSAQATITDSSISGNFNGVEVEGDGSAQATITGCLISANSDGGVIVEHGTVALQTSTLDGNNGAGLVLDSAHAEGTLIDSTVSNTVPFSNSQTSRFGGGVVVVSGGIATIQTSTIFGNTGQGILAFGDATITIENSTISGTKPGADDSFPNGGVAVARPEPARPQAEGAGITLTGTIVASQAATVPDCSDAGITDSGYNLDSDSTCAFSVTGSLSGRNPNLGPLANNGGPTKTLLPGTGSPAINAIPPGAAGCVANVTDQRDTSRPQPAGGACDIGAVEVVQAPSAAVSPTPALDPRALLLLAGLLSLLAVTHQSRR